MHTVIPLSKTKLLFSLAGSLLFIFLGYMILTDIPPKLNPDITKVLGIITMVFFGTTFIVALIKLLDKKPGLVIDDNGILDNSSGVSAGLIAWKDIIRIDVKQIISTKFLIIHTTNPDVYLKRVGPGKSWIMKRNIGLYGSPIAIPSTTLRYDFDKLKNLILVELEKHNGNRIA